MGRRALPAQWGPKLKHASWHFKQKIWTATAETCSKNVNKVPHMVLEQKEVHPRTGHQRGGTATALLFNLGATWGVTGEGDAPAALPPGKTAGPHRAGGWVGHGAGLERCRKSRPYRSSIPGPASP
jgi:hypothetical protein